MVGSPFAAPSDFLKPKLCRDLLVSCDDEMGQYVVGHYTTEKFVNAFDEFRYNSMFEKLYDGDTDQKLEGGATIPRFPETPEGLDTRRYKLVHPRQFGDQPTYELYNKKSSAHIFIIDLNEDKDNRNMFGIKTVKMELAVGQVPGGVHPIDAHDPFAVHIRCLVSGGWVDTNSATERFSLLDIPGQYISCYLTHDQRLDPESSPPPYEGGRIRLSDVRTAIASALSEAITIRNAKLGGEDVLFPTNGMTRLLRDRWTTEYYQTKTHTYRIELELARPGVPFGSLACYKIQSNRLSDTANWRKGPKPMMTTFGFESMKMGSEVSETTLRFGSTLSGCAPATNSRVFSLRSYGCDEESLVAAYRRDVDRALGAIKTL